MLKSLEEKQESYVKTGNIEHWMYVHELKALLDKLDPNYVLTPNYVHNLYISRGDDGGVGYIDFHRNDIVLFEKGA